MCYNDIKKGYRMAEMRGVHMRFTDAQILYVTEQADKKNVNKSEVVRQLLNKAIKKNGKLQGK